MSSAIACGLSPLLIQPLISCRVDRSKDSESAQVSGRRLFLRHQGCVASLPQLHESLPTATS